MRPLQTALCVVTATGLLGLAAARASAPDTSTSSWDAKKAAAYLDGRMEWWSTWPTAARDRETFCVSCHSAAPYALARPVLRGHLKEAVSSPQEQRLIANVSKRVALWGEVAPFYPDQTRGIPKTSESRGSESILNALILSARDAQAGTLSDETRKAFANMWALQMRTGDLNGAWAWLNFHLEPFESTTAPFVGATLAATAVGMAPGAYASSADAAEGLTRLRAFLTRGVEQQNIFNKLMLMVASSTLDGLLSAEQRTAIVNQTRSLQQADGGWSLSGFGSWTRSDKSAPDTRSDGFATALATLALQRAGVQASEPMLARGLEWLRRNQDPTTGHWTTASLNKQRDPSTEPSKFMSDLATAYAVLSLTTASATSTR
jgi:squalene-hopene/tetraprenyl-beta-curcumene cyclase